MTQEEIDEAFRQAGGSPKNPQVEVHRGRGAPSEYKPEYCQKLIEYFDIEPVREIPETWYNPDGSVKRESMKLVANPPRHIGGFARLLGVAKSTVYDWARKYPDFAYSLLHARDMRRAMIIDNALSGLYNPLFAKLAAANLFGWHDRQDVNHTGEVKSVIVRYHKPEREAIPVTGQDKTGLRIGGEDKEKGREAPPIKVLAQASEAAPASVPVPVQALQDPKGFK
jgi:hypothetical protein